MPLQDRGHGPLAAGVHSPGPRPLAVLDVDGVVVLENPQVPVDRHTVSAYGKWRREVLVPTAAPAILRELGERFDCAWVSAWAHTAHPALRAALRLPTRPWPWRGVQFHKLHAIRALAAGRPWIWIDDGIDDLGTVPPQPDGLLVRVRPDHGITDLDPEQLLVELTRLTVRPTRPNRKEPTP